MLSVDRNVRFSFSLPVLCRRMSIIRQDSRSTRLRMALRSGSCGVGTLALDLEGMTAMAPSSAMDCRIAALPQPLSATMAEGGASQFRNA